MTRSQVTRPGSKASRPIEISTNDEPQISPIQPNTSQSAGVNAPRWVPSEVDRTRAIRPRGYRPRATLRRDASAGRPT